MMPLYTFYPCRPDGASETFVSFDLIDDAEAYVRSLHILDQHPSASAVVAWQGERKVHIRSRIHPDLQAVLTRSPSERAASRRDPP